MAIDTDVIAAQFNQVESGQAYITSAIPTTTIPVTRTADAHSWTMSTAFKNLIGDVADSPFTMVCEWTPKFDYGDTSGNASIITTDNSQYNIFYVVNNGLFVGDDNSEISYVDPNYTANTTYVYALRVYDDAGTMKFEVGEKHGGSWTWDESPADYSSSFNPSVNFLIGYLNAYPFNIKNIYFYDEAKTQAWIESEFTTVALIPVFPGAEGFGTETIAGRGGDVYRVTNLDDSGAGSLRACMEASGPRVCIFEKSGTIDITDVISVTDPFLTVAGATAPSPGITIKGAGLSISTHDVLIQHLRVRIGDSVIGPNPINRDGIALSSQVEGTIYNVVIDHCSVSWAIDENVQFWYLGVDDVTISNSIISEALYDSIHPDGAHSMGMIVGSGPIDNVAIIGNLFANNHDRNPLIKGGTKTVLVNNVVFNPGWYGHIFSNTTTPGGALQTSVVGNIIIPGLDSHTTARLVMLADDLTDDTKVFVDDNMCDDETEDPWLCVYNNKGDIIKATEAPIWSTGLTAMPVSEVLESVLANAGSRPVDRDAVDTRVVAGVVAEDGRIIDSQDDVGGWPTLAENTRALTLPDNPNDDSGNGYTNLEVWLHGYADAVEM